MKSFATLLARGALLCALAFAAATPSSAQESPGVYFERDRALYETAAGKRKSIKRQRAIIQVGAAFGVSIGNYGVHVGARAAAGRSGIALRAGLHVGHCTPAPLRSFAAQWGLTIISAHRAGARVRGSGRTSLHAHCNGHSGAIDAYPRRGQAGAVIASARARGFGVGTYSGCHHHIHFSVGGHERRFHQSYGCGRRVRR